MRIALYTGTFVKDKDGVARTLYEFVKSIRDTGHEVMIWSPDVTEGDHTIPLNVTKLASVPVVVYPDYKLGFFGPRTKKQLDDFSPDIIHISTPDLVGREFLQYGRRNNIPVVSAYHTDFPSYLQYYQLSILTPPVWGYLKWFYSSSALTLVPTVSMQQRLKENGITNSTIWSRGINGDQFSPDFRSEKMRKDWNAQEKKVILYSGRFVWYKDLKVFISVYDRLTRKRDDIVFVLAGSGPAHKELTEAMPDAIFPGYLKGKKLSQVYASSDILFFPSTTETFGNVVQEALASGIPAVVSDSGGCRDIVSISRGGLISKAKDPFSFEQNLTLLLDDDALYQRSRKNGLNFAKKRAWKYINKKLLLKYSTLIAEDIDK